MKKMPRTFAFRAAKSLRWLENNFPYQSPAVDDSDRLANCIHCYCRNGALCIEALLTELDVLKAALISYGVELLLEVSGND